MRKLITTLAILFVVATAARPQMRKGNDPREFKELIRQYWETWSTLNPEEAAPMYAKESDAVFFDVAPLKYNGWDEYKAGVLKVFANAASASFTPNDDLKVTRRGKIAWTSNTFHGTVNQKDGKTMQLEGRQTGIWEMRGGKWIIVHEHISAPLP